jgi:hypothetical protein
MRLFSFVIIFVFPAFVFASSPDCLPQDDSCSVRIKHSSECIQKCEQGLYKAGQLISDREWNSFIEKMINSSPTGTKDEKPMIVVPCPYFWEQTPTIVVTREYSLLIPRIRCR